MLSVTFDDWGGAGPMTLTFPSNSAGPGPHSVGAVGLKFYKLSAEIAVPFRVILIPIFHTCVWQCFMFSELRKDWRRRIGPSATADHLRDYNNGAGIGNNTTGIGDNSAEIGDDATGIVDIAAKVTPC